LNPPVTPKGGFAHWRTGGRVSLIIVKRALEFIHGSFQALIFLYFLIKQKVHNNILFFVTLSLYKVTQKPKSFLFILSCPEGAPLEIPRIRRGKLHEPKNSFGTFPLPLPYVGIKGKVQIKKSYMV
jgi:hypothetical protein